ncbi:MAG TPA: hypothetical protein VH144_00775 [Candidatus Saccharimonadales bacterium]|jgi:hypothetical protein|nr:hypothetical protein [Candidatus Saccharimonadales bacterium]
MREILGLTGNIGAGKTETANILTAINPEKHVHYETSTYVSKIGDGFNAAFADHIEGDYIERVNKTFGDLDFDLLFSASRIDSTKLLFDERDIEADPAHYEKLFAYMQNLDHDPALLDQPIAAGDKDLYQWLGNHFVTRIHPHVWFREIFYDVKQRDADKELIIVGGVRYPADATYVRTNGTNTAGRIVEIERPDQTAERNTPSEIRRREIKADVRIINNGTLADLGDLCLRFYDDLQRGKLDHAYRTILHKKAA